MPSRKALISFEHVRVLGLLLAAIFLLSRGAYAATPIVSNKLVQLRTLDTGDVVVNVSATVADSDSLAGIRVTVERPGVFGPYPLQPGLYRSPGEPPYPTPLTSDGYSVSIGAEFIPEAQRAGDYVITVHDGATEVSTTVTLPAGLTALAVGGPTTIQLTDDLERPGVSIPLVPGASGYRIVVLNDSDSTSTRVDRVAGPDLNSSSSIRLGDNSRLETGNDEMGNPKGKFYRLSIEAFDGTTVASSHVRSESTEICYDAATGRTDIPCLAQKDVHLITESDGTVVMQVIGRVLDSDAEFCTEDPFDALGCRRVVPVPVAVTIKRGDLGPFDLTPSILRDVDIDSDVTERFASSRDPLDESKIPVNERPGDYTFEAKDLTDLTESVVSVNRNFPPGLTPFPPAGALTIDTSTGQLTPTASISPVPGASNYRVVVFNDTDSTRKNFDNLPGGTLSESPSVQIFPGVIEPNKFYRIHMDAFNDQTFSTSTVRSRSASMRYDPSGLDSDGDGIQDTIDLSASFSDDFSNVGRGGNISGTIVDRADLDVVVIEPPDTAINGLRVGAAGGGSLTAKIIACPPPPTEPDKSPVIHYLTERDAEEIEPCGSLNVAVLDGIIEYQLGTQGFVIAPAGARLTIDEPSPGQYTVENSEQSLASITLLKGGEEITVPPGTPGVSIPVVEIKPDAGRPNCVNPKSKGNVPVAILGGDVMTIVQSSLELDDDANAATAGVKPEKTSLKDVSGDGVSDLIAHFNTQDLNDAGLLSNGRILYFTGQLSDGTLLVGSDVIYLSDGPTCN